MMDGVHLEAKALDQEWLAWFYDRVTNHFTLSRESLHNTHQWVITLTLGLVTAVLTLASSQQRYPSEFGFIALLVSIPLMLRFFVRSCLECSIQHKWRAIRDAMDVYFYVKRYDPRHPDLGLQAERYLRETIVLFYFNWKSPKRLRGLVWENLRLTYLWPFALLLSLLVWGAAEVHMTAPVAVTSVLVFVYAVYEIIGLMTYRGFQYAAPRTRPPHLALPELLPIARSPEQTD